jgi:hypothetical protein
MALSSAAWQTHAMIKPAAEPLVWHYTSVNSLNLMLQGRGKGAEHRATMRMGHADYLNNPREQRLVLEVFETILKECASEAYKAARAAEGLPLGPDPDSAWMYDSTPFTVSFSNNEDNLLLWSLYSGNLSGVAIGFRRDVLRRLQLPNGAPLRFESVIYDENELRVPLINDVVRNRQRLADQAQDGLNSPDWSDAITMRLLGSTIANYKSAGWTQEEEVRLIFRAGTDDWPHTPAKRAQARELWEWDNPPLKPFITLPFDAQEAIAEVRVGPLGSWLEVRSVLTRHGLDVPVVNSPTKYRRPGS